MNKADKESTIKVYSGLLRDNGTDSSLGLGWSSKRTQETRFRVLTEIASLAGHSLLDGGCGVGDLYGYLRRREIAVDYCGLDVCPQMLTAARSKYPAAEFLPGELDASNLGRRFDYVLISGAFNWTISDNFGVARRGLRQAWEICRKGVACNFLSSREPYKVDYLYYFSPEDMKAYAESFAGEVTMRHDYKMNDFTLYLYKESEF